MAAMSPTLTKFMQKFVRGDKEGILLKDAADDDHRMGPHDVNHRVAREFAEMVSADDRIVVAAPYFVYTRLELNDIVDMRPIFYGPIHMTTNATQWKRSLGVVAGQLLECRYHAIRIETAIGKVDVSIYAKLQLPALLRDGRINPCLVQSLQVTLTLIGIHDVNRLVAALEPVFYKWKQDPIFLVVAMEEGADVTSLV
jgi:hypothetical protein